MPDNKTYQTRLVDRGWSEMQRILDREMPRRRNRRIAFIWFGIAGLIVAASVTLMQQSGIDSMQNAVPRKSAPEARPADVQDSPVALHEDFENGKGRVEAEDTEGATHTNSATSTEHMRTVTAEESLNINNEHETAGSSPKAHEQYSTTQKNVTQHEQATDVLALELQTGSNSIADTGHSLEHAVQNGSEAPAQGSPAVGDDMRTDSQSQPTTDMQYAEHRELYPSVVLTTPDPKPLFRPDVLASSAVIPRTGTQKVGVDLIARAHLNGHGDPLYGAEAGIVTVFRAHRRLQIVSGASYGYYAESGLGVFGSTADEELIDLNNQPGNPWYGVAFDVQDVYTNSIGYDSARLLTDKFHYLHIPLSIAYRVTPRLSIWGGARASVLLAAPSRYALDDQIFSSTSGADMRTGSKSFLYDYDVLRKIDISPEMGVSWEAFHGLWLEAAYRHGMVPYINRSQVPERSDFHRSLSIGLRLRVI